MTEQPVGERNQLQHPLISATQASSAPDPEIQKIQLRGLSMRPWFEDGDRIVVRMDARKDLEAGDIVLRYLRRDSTETFSLVAHRAIRKDSGVVVTKGDRAYHEDREFGEILGLVVGRERNGTLLLWGLQGQPFKRVFAWLSARAILGNPFRRGYLLGVMLYYYLSRAVLLMRRSRSS